MDWIHRPSATPSISPASHAAYLSSCLFVPSLEQPPLHPFFFSPECHSGSKNLHENSENFEISHTFWDHQFSLFSLFSVHFFAWRYCRFWRYRQYRHFRQCNFLLDHFDHFDHFLIHLVNLVNLVMSFFSLFIARSINSELLLHHSFLFHLWNNVHRLPTRSLVISWTFLKGSLVVPVLTSYSYPTFVLIISLSNITHLSSFLYILSIEIYKNKTRDFSHVRQKN